MIKYGNIAVRTGSLSKDGEEERSNQPPNTESWSLCGDISASRCLQCRTIVKFKRRQGTHVGRKEGVTPLLKQISLDTYKNTDGDRVIRLESNTIWLIMVRVSIGLSGSKSMARWEREVRNLGGTHSLSAFSRVGGTTNRSEPIWLWVADRLTRRTGQAACKPARRPDLCRSGRQSNIACKGNMTP